MDAVAAQGQKAQRKAAFAAIRGRVLQIAAALAHLVARLLPAAPVLQRRRRRLPAAHLAAACRRNCNSGPTIWSGRAARGACRR